MAGSLLLWMILLPLAGSIVNGLILRTPFPRRAGVIATAFAGASFVLAILLFGQLVREGHPISVSLDWFDAGPVPIQWGFSFDWLTAAMAMIVTGIGTVIHLYSIGYMSDDRTPYRYFAYLNLFLFAMLTLISSDNLPVMFVGWEGVGVCSYLLIGYWYQDLKNANAGMKAFIVNRIGDAGFLLGIFLLFTTLNTLNFHEMAVVLGQRMGTSTSVGIHTINMIALFLFIGATGKSAQIPLYVWLPDAMAGPTPVSALIHAATMVTAGIYMTLRMHFLFVLATDTNMLIAAVGAATALLAALIATSQNDIKKVLAYSTVSQLGLMFLGLGTGAYFAAFFHLMTHAFFKALLFLGAGSVIHALSGEQDIGKMGGLRKALPWTFLTFSIGTLAIAGIPPLAGFFSKDTLLYGALSGPHGTALWAVGSFASLLTAFYMARLYVLVFFGESRVSHDVHPHESPAVMTIPLMILAVGSALAGFLGMPEGFHMLPNYLAEFLAPVIGAPVEPQSEPFLSEFGAMGVATFFAIVGVGFGFWLYAKPSRSQKLGLALKPLRTLFAEKFYVDEIYDWILIKPYEGLCGFLARVFDGRVIDALLIFPARIARAGGTC